MFLLDLNDQNQLIDILTNPKMTTYRESDFTISEIFDLISSSSSSISRGDVGLHALKLKGSDIIIGVIGNNEKQLWIIKKYMKH